MSEGQSSSTVPDEAPPSLPLDPDSIYGADLILYQDACHRDFDLKAFESNILERTKPVLETLAADVKDGTLSMDSLGLITSSLLEINQEVVKVIHHYKKDIWDNKSLLASVEDYFNNSHKTLDFCTVLQDFLMHAQDSLMNIRVAIKCFQEEVEDGTGEKKYAKTLEGLHKFKAAKDTFVESFFVRFRNISQTISEQQKDMLKKLRQEKKKIDKKSRTVTNVIFAASLVQVLIFSAVAIAVPSVSPSNIVTTIKSVVRGLGWVADLCISLLKTYQDALKAQRAQVIKMEVGTFTTIKEIDNICFLVGSLEIVVQSLMRNVEFAIGGDGGVELAISEIKSKLEAFTTDIQDLNERAGRLSQKIMTERTNILEAINKYSTAYS